MIQFWIILRKGGKAPPLARGWKRIPLPAEGCLFDALGDGVALTEAFGEGVTEVTPAQGGNESFARG